MSPVFLAGCRSQSCTPGLCKAPGLPIVCSGERWVSTHREFSVGTRLEPVQELFRDCEPQGVSRVLI